jgi:predicted RNA-binding Zn-ribbon protein involved in translation (DUF1610 family)
MTKIRATCPECGTVEFGVTEIVLLAPTPERAHAYRFSCPECRRRVDRATQADVIELLRSVGVVADEYPPFTHGDIEHLRELLDDPEWIRSLMRSA